MLFGKFGIDEYGIELGFSNRSPKPPNPLPQTIPIFGLILTRSKIQSAIDLTLSYV